MCVTRRGTQPVLPPALWRCRGRSGGLSDIEGRKFIIFITLGDRDELTFIKAGLEALHFSCNVLSMTVNATPDDLVKKLFNQRSN